MVNTSSTASAQPPTASEVKSEVKPEVIKITLVSVPITSQIKLPDNRAPYSSDLVGFTQAELRFDLTFDYLLNPGERPIDGALRALEYYAQQLMSINWRLSERNMQVGAGNAAAGLPNGSTPPAKDEI